MVDTEDLLRRFKRAKSRGSFDTLFQDLADLMSPNMASFTRQQTEGGRRHTTIYDGTPMLAVRGMVNAIDGLLKPKTAKWTKIKAVDEALDSSDSARLWMEQATDIMFGEFYRPKARFIQSSGETDRSLVVLGSGTLFTKENRDLDGLAFRSLPMAHIFFQENADGIIDTLYWHTHWEARIAEEFWGREKLSPEVKKALEENRDDAKFEFLQVIRPRKERNPESRLPKDMPWEYISVEIVNEHIIEESGFMEWPFATPRWDTESGEVYGRSPGMVALPDSKTLQQQGRTILRAGHLAVQPPLMAPHESIVRGPSLVPGGITYYNAAALRNAGISDPLRPLFTGSQIPLAREMQNDTRDQVFAAFFRNVLNLPVNGPEMTATEVIERKEEFVRELGPIFGKLESDYLSPMVERSFSILMRQGKFPPPPEELQGQQIRFEFESPIEKVRSQIESMGAVQTVNMLGPFVQADPSIMDNFNGDSISRDVSRFNSMPQRWLRPEKERDAIREARLKADQQELQAQALERAAAAEKTLSEAERNVS